MGYGLIIKPSNTPWNLVILNKCVQITCSLDTCEQQIMGISSIMGIFGAQMPKCCWLSRVLLDGNIQYTQKTGQNYDFQWNVETTSSFDTYTSQMIDIMSQVS